MADTMDYRNVFLATLITLYSLLSCGIGIIITLVWISNWALLGSVILLGAFLMGFIGFVIYEKILRMYQT